MLDEAILTALRTHGPLGLPRLVKHVGHVARRHAPASHPDDVVTFRLQALCARGVAQRVQHRGWRAVE